MAVFFIAILCLRFRLVVLGLHPSYVAVSRPGLVWFTLRPFNFAFHAFFLFFGSGQLFLFLLELSVKLFHHSAPSELLSLDIKQQILFFFAAILEFAFEIGDLFLEVLFSVDSLNAESLLDLLLGFLHLVEIASKSVFRLRYFS